MHKYWLVLKKKYYYRCYCVIEAYFLTPAAHCLVFHENRFDFDLLMGDYCVASVYPLHLCRFLKDSGDITDAQIANGWLTSPLHPFWKLPWVKWTYRYSNQIPLLCKFFAFYFCNFQRRKNGSWWSFL